MRLPIKTLVQAPRWLPYRLRSSWDEARIHSVLRRLDRTLPQQAQPLHRAVAEAHMLLCRRDVPLSVLALKSLLRFPEARLAVTLSEDGSLTDNDRAWINRHVPGCAWLPRIVDESRLVGALQARPFLAGLYQSAYHPLRKLVHPIALARHERIIVVDPDTAFFRCPERLLRWTTGDDSRALFLHDQQDEQAMVPSETREAFGEIADLLTPPGESWSMPYFFFNSGLLAFRAAECDLDLAERYLEWHAQAPPRYSTGKPGLWFGDWTPEQTAYQVMFARMAPAPTPLGVDYHLGGASGHVFNHFMRYYLVRETTLRMLADLIAELPTQGRNTR